MRPPVLAAALPLLASSALAQGVIHTFPGGVPQEHRPTVAAGDVDGDGFGDLVVLTITGLEVVDVRSGRTGALLHSFSGSRSAGTGPAIAGGIDLDGDGRDDLVIGDPERASFWPHPSAGGTARAVSGATGLTLWTIAGAPDDALGTSLSAGPDVDQDGFPDVAVGADQATLTGARPGFVRVVSGATAQTLATRVGPTAGARYGAEVALLADADGDGAADLAVAARHPVPAQTWTGGVEVVSLAPGAVLWSVTGANPLDGLGTGLLSLGDLDGDG
ncbi:MAG: integrin alpha, partial [Planctomycetota bacterium JB042]